jgi:hypothetical protein
VDHVRTALLHPGRLGLAIQVEGPTFTNTSGYDFRKGQAWRPNLSLSLSTPL